MSRVIVVRRPAKCLTCDEPVDLEEKANWEHGVGIWHLDCPTPDNLEHYIKERDKRARLLP